MTRNLYLGADLNPALAAIGVSRPLRDLHAVDATRGSGTRSSPRTSRRARRCSAKEIDDERVRTIVGLQEVALWRSGPVNGVKDATTVDVRLPRRPCSELGARRRVQGRGRAAGGGHREPSGTAPTTPTPRIGGSRCATSILVAHATCRAAKCSFSNPQSANYANFISTCRPARRTATSSSSAAGRRSTSSSTASPIARFVEHAPRVGRERLSRWQQASELVGASGPVRCSRRLPAIIAGDLNSDPAIPFRRRPGLRRSRTARRSASSPAPGSSTRATRSNTFGHNANVNEFPSNVFTERIDHVMLRAAGSRSPDEQGRRHGSGQPDPGWPVAVGPRRPDRRDRLAGRAGTSGAEIAVRGSRSGAPRRSGEAPRRNPKSRPGFVYFLPWNRPPRSPVPTAAPDR